MESGIQEQPTYMLFLKMADEYTRPPYNRSLPIPAHLGWQSLTPLKGAELETHYSTVLRELGGARGILGQIFTKSQNKIQDPAKLYKLVQLIDAENWIGMDADVKGDIYEGLRKTPKTPRAVPASTSHSAADPRHGGMREARARPHHCRPGWSLH